MAAPTLAAVGVGGASATTAVTPTLSWQTGDVLVAVTGDGGGNATISISNTGSGLSWGAALQSHKGASDATAFAYTTTATASSSGTVTCTDGSSGTVLDCAVFVWRNSGGIGNSVITSTPGSALTVSLTMSAADSAVVWYASDFNTVAPPSNDATTDFTPTASSHNSSTPGPSAVPRAREDSGFTYTFYEADLDDQTSTGTISYGVAGVTGTHLTIVAVEVTASAGTPSNSNCAGVAASLGGGSGSWSNIPNATGPSDSSNATWTAP